MNTQETEKKGVLYVVSTPIGNNDDITLRALEILKTTDILVAEEGKIGARLLAYYRINKEIEELNEHNEAEQTPELLQKLLNGQKLALVSDAGTPLFADPGASLVRKAIQNGISVMAIPGASSIMSALVVSGLPLNQFVFAGFLSRKPEERDEELRSLAKEHRTVVLLETPYRLQAILDAAAGVMPDRQAFLGCNLTMQTETRHYGTFEELREKFSTQKFKGEFVICFAPYGNVIEQISTTYADERAIRRDELSKKRFRRDSEYIPAPRNEDSFERKPFENKRFERRGDSSDRRFGEKRFGDKKFGDRKFGDKKFGEKKFGDRKFNDRKFEDRDFGEKKFGDRKFNDRKFEDRGFGEKKFGDRKFNDRKFEDRDFGERKFNDRRSEDRGFSDRKFGDKKFGDKKFGDRKFGDKKFGDKKFGDKKFGDKKFGDKKFGDRKFEGKSERFGDEKPFRKFGGKSSDRFPRRRRED